MNMIATTTSFPIPVHTSAGVASETRANRRRRITPQAGHALEILGHAIEYLADELVNDGAELSAHNERVQAVQLLMALNRQVYFECPVAPTFGERCRKFLRGRQA